MRRSARRVAWVAIAVGEIVIALAAGIGHSAVAGAVADVTPPEVHSDAVSSYVASATITIFATDAESGVDYVSYNLDGAG